MRKILLVGVFLGLLSLFVVLAACGEDLQPQVDQLQKENQTLKELQPQVDQLQKENQTLAQENESLQELVGILPASLDNYFPPKAPAPLWLLEMFALSGTFEGIIGDLQQGDIAGVQANYQAFKTQYTKMAGMVPEWTTRFPQAPVDALGQALASGDPAKVGPAMGQVGAVCGACHELYMVKAQQKYHWPDFRQVKVTDPLTQQSLPYKDYMMAVSGPFGGISTDLQQGQVDNARQNFEAFNTRFQKLAEGCNACHTTPRTYFVDASVQGMIDQLGEALAAATPDPQAIGQLSGAIGMESCLKCHWVHFPAQNTKVLLEKATELTK